MLKTISRACASRVWLNILFTVVNDLFSIFYNVLFFAYFMETVEKGESIIQVGKVLIIFVLINIVFELLNSYYNQKYIPQNDVKLSLFLKNMIYKKIMEVDIECFDNPEYYDNVTFTLNDLFERVKNILNNLDFKVDLNIPYSGGYIVKKYSTKNVNTLQIELNYKKYIDNKTFSNEDFPKVNQILFTETQEKLKYLFENIIPFLNMNI